MALYSEKVMLRSEKGVRKNLMDGSHRRPASTYAGKSVKRQRGDEGIVAVKP